MSKKSRFRGPLNRQDGKRTETLFQSQRQKIIELEKVSLSDM